MMPSRTHEAAQAAAAHRTAVANRNARAAAAKKAPAKPPAAPAGAPPMPSTAAPKPPSTAPAKNPYNRRTQKAQWEKWERQKAVAANKDKPDYGFVAAFLNQHPDIKKMVAQATKERWTPERLQAEVRDKSQWWKSRTDAQRKWDLLETSNPAEAKAQVDAMAASIRKVASNGGLTLSDDQIGQYARQFVSTGAKETEIQSVLGATFTLPTQASQPVTGTASQTLDDIQKYATSYGVHLDDGTKQAYVRQVLQGQQTTQGLQDVFREQAKILYPTVAAYLDANPDMGVKDYISPYLSAASRELGVPIEQMSIQDSKWTRMLNGSNGGPMSVDEWTTTIRTDPRYGWDRSPTAVTNAYQLADSLKSIFAGG